MKFDPYHPVAEICFGREKILGQVVSGAINRRCVLLFGGRQSGKTTALLRIEADLSRHATVTKLDSFICPVYIDLTVLQVDAVAADFFKLLASSAITVCTSIIEGFKAPSLAECGSVESFAAAIKEITKSSGNVDLTLLFLIDEAERVLGERFPRGFQDNLFAILYGPELASESKLGIVFSGAQGLYKFSEDETSPIGSRAGYQYLKNLEKDDISLLMEVLHRDFGMSLNVELSSFVHGLTGGHAGLTSRLVQYISQNRILTADLLKDSLESFVVENRQLMRLWATSLSAQARALHDRLAISDSMSRKDVVVSFTENGWDPFLADRAIEELTFTGIARFDAGVLWTCCTIYWQYIKDYFPTGDESKAPEVNKKQESDDNEVVWRLIEKAEIGLRSYVGSIYSDRFKAQAEQKIERALGHKAMEKVRSNVDRSNSRYKYTPRQRVLNIFDGLYLGQLGQLMMWNEAWPFFKHLTQDKREMEILLAPINAVRTDQAHFYEVPARELSRCKLHCEDIISLVEKYRSQDTV